MSIDITLTDKQGNEINYDANSMLSEATHYGYISITYNLASILQALPCNGLDKIGKIKNYTH